MKKYIPKVIGISLNFYSYISINNAAEKALQLFATPRKGKLTEKHLGFLNTAERKTLSYEKFKIATYKWEGHKDTVLLVHGWESNAARWKKKIKALLKEGYRVIALDAPAHGDSGSQTFNAILYAEFINVVATKFQPKIIIGHSVGAMATTFFMHKFQFNAVEKLVLLGSPSDFKDVFKRYVIMMGYNKAIEEQLDTIIYNRFGEYPSYFSVANFVKNISQKGLLIHDTQDKIIPYSDALRIHKNYDDSEFVSTTGFGHSLKHLDVVNTVMEFINR
ncbi:alpha/beta fold hydrolase [Flavobacteriaceae bacterium AU392]|nr:alpha/beta hydrolase [Flavobacteriaceae bacterium]RKM81302.1 alpha/beta fold hydrolase [Flavobacteriaceae bacterium AU392]